MNAPARLRSLLALPLLATSAALAQDAPQEEPPDLRKTLTERPAEDLLRRSGARETPAPATSAGASKVPVEPGRVAWRRDRDAAREAARASGRPVLVFQMLGDLDDEYC